MAQPTRQDERMVEIVAPFPDGHKEINSEEEKENVAFLTQDVYLQVCSL